MASLTDFLSDHADALNRESPFIDEFTASLWMGVWSQPDYVASLLFLAKMLKQILRPVSPQADFRADLRHQLLYGEPIGEPESSLSGWSALFGFMAFSLVGLLVFIWRWWGEKTEADTS